MKATDTMVGASSNTGTMQQGKRNKCASWAPQPTKRQHHSQTVTTPPLDGIADPVVLLQETAMASYPVSGVNRATLSTTAAPGAARSGSTMLPLQPLVDGADEHDAHSLQMLGTVTNMVASAPQIADVNGIALVAPLVLAHVADQLVPLPVRFYGYVSMDGTTSMTPPAEGTSLPLAVTLYRIQSVTLTRMLSVLTRVCYPPLRQHVRRSGAPPQWWPTGSEHWWVHEVAAHLPRMPALPVPFLPGKLLTKPQKVAVLVAIMKHLSPDFARMTTAAKHCRLSASEEAIWNSALENEQADNMRVRPVYFVQLQQHGGGSGSHLLPSQNVLNDAIAATVGMARLADNGGHMVAAAGVEQQKELLGDGGGDHLSPSQNVLNDAVAATDGMAWSTDNGVLVVAETEGEQSQEQLGGNSGDDHVTPNQNVVNDTIADGMTRPADDGVQVVATVGLEQPQIQLGTGDGGNLLPSSHNVMGNAVAGTDGMTRPADHGTQVVTAAKMEQPQENVRINGGSFLPPSQNVDAILATDDMIQPAAIGIQVVVGAELQQPQEQLSGGASSKNLPPSQNVVVDAIVAADGMTQPVDNGSAHVVVKAELEQLQEQLGGGGGGNCLHTNKNFLSNTVVGTDGMTRPADNVAQVVTAAELEEPQELVGGGGNHMPPSQNINVVVATDDMIQPAAISVQVVVGVDLEQLEEQLGGGTGGENLPPRKNIVVHAVAAADSITQPADNIGAQVVVKAELEQLQEQLDGGSGDDNHLPPNKTGLNDTVSATNIMTRPVGNYAQAVAAAELEQLQEQLGGGGGHSGTAPAFVTIPSDEVYHMVASEAEQEEEQQPGQDGGVDFTIFSIPDPGPQLLEDVLAQFAGEQADDLHPDAVDNTGMDIDLVGEAAVTGKEADDCPWYKNKELRHMFATMHLGSPHAFDDGWYS